MYLYLIGYLKEPNPNLFIYFSIFLLILEKNVIILKFIFYFLSKKIE